MQFVTRKIDIDIAHRVMREAIKCYNNHGHRYNIFLTFSFEQSEDIGYAIDFKEIKRVYCQWIDDMFDHGAIYNPHDTDFIAPCVKHGTKLWLMSLNGVGAFCNPSVENVAKEMFIAIDYMAKNKKEHIYLHKIDVWETGNCYTTCKSESITESERANFLNVHREKLDAYIKEVGTVEYDILKRNTNETGSLNCQCGGSCGCSENVSSDLDYSKEVDNFL